MKYDNAVNTQTTCDDRIRWTGLVKQSTETNEQFDCEVIIF